MPHPGGRGVMRVDVMEERQLQRCVDEPTLAALTDVARTIERYFGAPRDIDGRSRAETNICSSYSPDPSRPSRGVSTSRSQPTPCRS